MHVLAGRPMDGHSRLRLAGRLAVVLQPRPRPAGQAERTVVHLPPAAKDGVEVRDLPRVGWISMLLLESLQKQCIHPAEGLASLWWARMSLKGWQCGAGHSSIP